MKSFAAIDFETANQHRSSVCSVGIIIVKNASIKESFHELIKPTPNFYCHWATEIHGIRYWDTIRAKTFPEVWKKIAKRIKGLPLVAHNSPFDKSCLKAVHEFYEMDYPEYQFHCTYRTAKHLFPDLPNHQLHTVSEYLGFKLDNHHNALADAEACAHIAMKIF
jgi:DNA polymerase-3 subunit epsilon